MPAPENESDPPHQQRLPFTWTGANWLAAYQQMQQNRASMPYQTPPPTPEKEKPVSQEKMCGGWQFEGKEKPVSPKICTRCQWVRRTEDGQEPDKSSWCESCLEGKPGPGHMPDGPKKPYVSRMEDVNNYNKAFFGG